MRRESLLFRPSGLLPRLPGVGLHFHWQDASATQRIEVARVGCKLTGCVLRCGGS